ncbi:MAG TPA: UDP-N-acetylglucosamine 2-epimerase (non-hydrolyzing) [Bryobacteraceae bacterium]|nr:UDP-N-acetylglucosamine 2-epimerase (non-hydrolyzing) [Bryobacteraceae bacterium]
MKRILFIFGTRPEAIKLCPVIRYIRGSECGLEARTCVTAQHRAMLDQVLECFDLKPDYDLDLMTPGQTLAQITSRALSALDPILTAEKFDMAVVQGDTTTTLAAALAAFYHQIPVAHVEAGLRTGDMTQPFPEELNRVVTGRLAALHFAPTEGARRNLLKEATRDEQILVTGNTGIDAVLYMAKALETGAVRRPRWEWLDESKRLVVVTAHRRESFGKGVEQICEGLERLAARGDVQIVFPVHRNPNVLGPVMRRLGGLANVKLIEPLDYPRFVDLMRRAYVLITDSGGIQEEAPSLGKPVLVMRDCTERPEAVEAGTVKLVGADAGRIVREAERLLDDAAEYERMARTHNPYGDGRASERIVEAMAQYFVSGRVRELTAEI